MDHTVHNRIVNFIWSIADDCLRDVYVRGKYRDVILPMIVLRRLDTLLESTKEKVLEEMKFQKEDLELAHWDESGLKEATGYVFYNTSKWTMQKLHDTATNSQQILLANFEEYLDGFSDNVKEIIGKFKLKEQIRHMASKDILLDVLEKFTSTEINLTPFEKQGPDGKKLPPLTNLGMGYVFEELIRKFNEENNEEAGEHFTPREVIDLMTHIVFEPIKDKIPPVITIYDPACGSGGMLTESQSFIKDEEGRIRAKGDVYLFGKEVNDETYAICKSDMMIKGNDPQYIRIGSTLATDEFSSYKFDFMLSNPPYGKSWNSDVKYIKDGKSIIDPRFITNLKNFYGIEEEVDLIPRTNDGQLLFLMEMVNKMKSASENGIGSRIASVHNGSSLFTGDAESGESNTRRHIIENDLLEAIIQLPNNIFYNTGITTYIWLLSNNKPEHRKGKVQLIDASKKYKKLRKNLGDKNCELRPKHIQEIQDIYTDFKEVPRKGETDIVSKIFDNSDFGYNKVTIERPKRLKAKFSTEAIETLRFDKSLIEPMKWSYDEYGEEVYENLKGLEKHIMSWCDKNEIELNAKNKKALFSEETWKRQREVYEAAKSLMEHIGEEEHLDFNIFRKEVEKAIKELKLVLSAGEKNSIYGAITEYDERAEKVIKKKEKISKEKLLNLLEKYDCKPSELENYGYFPTENPEGFIIYETETNLRDYENIPLKENIYDYFIKEVKPYLEEAWMDLDKTKIGYEISFNKHFYHHKSLRDIQEVTKEIMELELENEGLITELLGGTL
ncbi:MAG: class I SAM-dependent DNA methyltransferase [Cetobacterium sp.]